ncbi:MAG: class I SAM-dependent methyltransferase [Polyangiaceae bacterium]|nr:class I SAM-dependent methyltransferase [Polyangiaceae bacterium]
MLREIAHFVTSAPATLRLMARLPQAELYDALMRGADDAGFAGRRADLARGLTGEVLEIGAGTGLMFSHYEEAARVTALEPDEAFSALARPRAAAARARVSVEPGAAESLPFDAARFDAVVVSLVLCSVASVPRVLSEIARVVRPGGEVRLIEHVRSERPVPGLLMKLLDPAWLLLNGQGCHMDRDAEAALRDAGFRPREVRPFQVFAPGLPAFPMRWIRADPPSMK